LIFDLHIHSKYSGDCTMEPAIILKVAKKKGLDGIAVTDHLTIKGGIETRKLNNDPDFLVIVGSEVETDDKADLIGLFLEEEIESTKTVDVITEIKVQGGLVLWAHPFRFGKNLLSGDVIPQVDLIEGFNSKTSASRNAPCCAGRSAAFVSAMSRARVGSSLKYWNLNSGLRDVLPPYTRLPWLV